jgi:FMN-dependent NADH-azoreductase
LDCQRCGLKSALLQLFREFRIISSLRLDEIEISGGTMSSILHIDSSPRGDRSKSRKLAKKFIGAWQDLHPDDVITYRDLRQTPVPHVTEDWIAASFTAPEALTSEMAELLKFSDELVDEFLAADRCVFSVPMYNFSIPSNFKAYIDSGGSCGSHIH